MAGGGEELTVTADVHTVEADVRDGGECDDDCVELGDNEYDLAVGTQRSRMKCTNTFLKPCQLLLHLSGYPNLTILYSIFCCLAVLSASAERALE